jgi:hypothetical protein
MKSSKLLIAGLAALMMVVASVGAFAAPVGTNVAVSSDIVKLFTDAGVDAQYVTAPVSTIPAAQLSLMRSVINDTTLVDDVAGTSSHDVLNRLVMAALAGSTTSEYSPVYLSVAGIVWGQEIGSTLQSDGETSNSLYVGL